MATVMLIDGNSLAYRAFFAVPQTIQTASGQITNAVYGFTSMLLNLLREHKPDNIAVLFDRPEPTFRHARIETYKGNREKAPEVLHEQMGLVREMVEAFRIPVVDLAGYEADDLIATLTDRAVEDGDHVVIVSGDRDIFQLVRDPDVRVLYTNVRGVSELKDFDEAGIFEKTGVVPSDYVEYAALRGDSSDNLPGVPGVGEKTAAKLINAYGSIDGVFEHAAEQTPKLRANLADHEEQVRLNVEVMRLVRDVPLDVTPDDLQRGAPDAGEIKRLFGLLEFRNENMHDRLNEVLAESGQSTSSDTQALEAELDEVPSAADAVKLLEQLGTSTEPLALAIAWAGADGRSSIEGIAFVTGASTGEVAYLRGALIDDGEVEHALASLFEAGGRPLAVHGAKPLMRALLPRGIDFGTLKLDTMLAAYLLDPAESRYLLEELLQKYTHYKLPDGDDDVADGQLDFGGGSTSTLARRAGRQALAVAHLAGPLLDALDARRLRTLNDTIEVPLVRVLARMEVAGIGVDVDALSELNDQMADECEALTKQIWADAGEQFNVNSTPKLREILFEQLGLKPQKKTKTGYSTDAASLEKLVGEHPIIEHLLRYREVEKLRSTYGTGLLAEVGDDSRIHATFNQTVARTGRLSSDAPNLHNIPVRTDQGRSFRKAFVPAEGFEFLVADYNQIELRCIAHLAEDPGLIHAFESGEDIHRATAARLFGVQPGDVTIEQRSKAKMVSYGLAYGMEAFGLGQRLNIPTSEAQVVLDAYFEAFPAVRDYMSSVVEEARAKGYTETLFGRRRQIPELASSRWQVRQAGERQAKNAGIQGLAADIFKVALVNLDAALESGGFRSQLILQVHDEVIVELDPAERAPVTEVTLHAMSTAFELRVPLEVNLSYGESWAAAKS
ncbi:MAG: DNA polymerase I [Actinobacteria bacterium]|nr:DNA polymerase I [Actinomycetota bacterium]